MGIVKERFLDVLERVKYSPSHYMRPANTKYREAYFVKLREREERRKAHAAWLREEAAKRTHPNAGETFTQAAVRYVLEDIPQRQSYAYVEFWRKDGWNADHINKAAKLLRQRGYEVQVKYSHLGTPPDTDRMALKVLL